jgi:hypothetical protein
MAKQVKKGRPVKKVVQSKNEPLPEFVEDNIPIESVPEETPEPEKTDPIVDATEEVINAVQNAIKFAEILSIRMRERGMSLTRVVNAKRSLTEVEKSLTPYLG